MQGVIVPYEGASERLENIRVFSCSMYVVGIPIHPEICSCVPNHACSIILQENLLDTILLGLPTHSCRVTCPMK
jgi:hypothetical protein